jgi:hypothetical protein
LYCTCLRASGTHLLVLYATTCWVRNVSPGAFYAFFQEFRVVITASKAGTVHGLCVVVAFRPSCIHPLYVTVGYRTDA